MTRKELLLVVFTALLAGVYLVFFTNWFGPKVIPVQYTVRPSLAITSRGRPQPAGTAPVAYALTFALNREYRLTGLKVVAVDEVATNPNAPALWHVVAPQRTPPMKGFAYGAPLPGMEPYLPGTEPRPLQPGVNYRLLVEAGRYHGTKPGGAVRRPRPQP
jgi:hypothetical protein